MTPLARCRLRHGAAWLAVALVAAGTRQTTLADEQWSPNPGEPLLAFRITENSQAAQVPAGKTQFGVATENAPRCPTCEELQQKWSKPLGQICPQLKTSEGVMPVDCTTNLFASAESAGSFHCWVPGTFCWVAPEVAFRTPYFEDVPLERYGQTASPVFQPVISCIRFYGTVCLMPYKVFAGPIRDTAYNTGYFRPGSDDPCVREPIR
jgi:hypothetical protein